MRLEPLYLSDVSLVLLFQQLDADQLLAAVLRHGDGCAERHLGADVIDDVSARANVKELMVGSEGRHLAAAIKATLQVGLLCLEEGDLKERN